MQKFVSQSDKNKEKAIQEELDIKSNFLDFFSSSDPNTIIEKINSTLADIKSKSKKEDSFYTKLIYFFSIVANSNTFKADDKVKTSIKKMIQICQNKVGPKYTKIYSIFSIITQKN